MQQNDSIADGCLRREHVRVGLAPPGPVAVDDRLPQRLGGRQLRSPPVALAFRCVSTACSLCHSFGDESHCNCLSLSFAANPRRRLHHTVFASQWTALLS